MNDDNSPFVDLQPKPMKGKYDKRCKSPKSIAAIVGAQRSQKQLGRKPNWMKHLSRNSAYKILQEFDDIVPFSEIYKWCWEHGKVELMVGMREYVWNRLEGRPFIAENPQKAEVKQTDPRIQEAIDRLLPKPKPPQLIDNRLQISINTASPKPVAAVSTPPTIEAQMPAEIPQQPVLKASRSRSDDGIPESTRQLIAEMKSRSR